MNRFKRRDVTAGEGHPAGKNKPSVWLIPTWSRKGTGHFATFPEALVEPCVLACARPGDLVLVPFAGTCTTGRV